MLPMAMSTNSSASPRAAARRTKPICTETKALITPAKLKNYLVEKMRTLGTAACPPYHIAFVIGGTSAEATLKTVKLASTKYYDGLPTEGNEHGRVPRRATGAGAAAGGAEPGLGAQFGGKYFAHDIRVIRLPRHGASCPVGMGFPVPPTATSKPRLTATASGSRSWRATRGNISLSICAGREGEAVKVNLNQPMSEIPRSCHSIRCPPACR